MKIVRIYYSIRLRCIPGLTWALPDFIGIDTSAPDVDLGTPPTQTLEDTSIYFTPQNTTGSSDEALDV